MKIKDIILAGITGIGIGIPVALLCMTLIGGYNEVIKEFLVWTVASALFGLVSVLFQGERFNLIVTTAIHCVCCMLITAGACFIIGYVKGFGEFLIAIVPVFLLVYVVIYFVTFISMKKAAKEANEALSNK